MKLPLALRSRHAPAILAYIKDAFRESSTDSAISITCPITRSTTYEIYPEGGSQPAGYYIAIDGDDASRDPLLNNIPSIDEAKAEIAVRIGFVVADFEKKVNTYNRIADQVGEAA